MIVVLHGFGMKLGDMEESRSSAEAEFRAMAHSV
ncbi:hypothetical protein A2U01_0006033, partial [Trifolium medium]|nr:hypothetical protein [Trifolium medium]